MGKWIVKVEKSGKFKIIADNRNNAIYRAYMIHTGLKHKQPSNESFNEFRKCVKACLNLI